jgi:hypothetical protein
LDDQSPGNAPDRGEQNQNQDTIHEQQAEDMVPRASLDEVNGKYDAMTKELDALASAEVEALPEDMRDIVPDLDPVAKLKWLSAAKAKGVFNKAPVRASDPDSKRPDTPKTNTGASEYEKYLKSLGA